MDPKGYVFLCSKVRERSQSSCRAGRVLEIGSHLAASLEFSRGVMPKTGMNYGGEGVGQSYLSDQVSQVAPLGLSCDAKWVLRQRYSFRRH